jgi:quercetin dioxygenase-like cupin family protein
MPLSMDSPYLSTQPQTKESIVSARKAPVQVAEGVELRMFASGECGATGFSTATATFRPGACMPYHLHEFSEAVTVLEGSARVLVEGRAYTLGSLDCMHVPAHAAHQVDNEDPRSTLVVLSAFASANLSRTQPDRTFPVEERGAGMPSDRDPETIVRMERAERYELSKDAFFCDLFARRLGAVGICGGYGRFLPGASLPCHTHDFDESITIVKGSAVSLVRGKRYDVSGYDTAFIPRGIPHRFLNEAEEEMAMIWVYAGDEPDRRIVRSEYCSGELAWPTASSAPQSL